MYKVIVIDDEPLARSVVMEYLQSHADLRVMQQCNDGFEGLKAINQQQPDLIFLDIQMPKITGFEMLELIDPMPSVIFTTAFDEYAIKAFETHAIDYLLKPFSQERFDKAIQKWRETKFPDNRLNSISELMNSNNSPAENQNRIVVKDGSQIKIIPITEVHYIEAYDDYVKINTIDNCYLKKKTMSFYESHLDPNLFIRVHRSYILSLSQLTKIDVIDKNNHAALLKNGTKIPLSKTGYSKLKETLGI